MSRDESAAASIDLEVVSNYLDWQYAKNQQGQGNSFAARSRRGA